MIHFACVHCGSIANNRVDDADLDEGTELECEACARKTVISLHTVAEYKAMQAWLAEKGRTK